MFRSGTPKKVEAGSRSEINHSGFTTLFLCFQNNSDTVPIELILVNLGRFLADFLMIIFMDFRRLHLAIAYPVPNYCQNQIKKTA